MKSSRLSRYVKRHPLRTQGLNRLTFDEKNPSYSFQWILFSNAIHDCFPPNLSKMKTTSLGHIKNYIHPPAKPLRMVKWPFCFPSQHFFSLRTFHNINQNLPSLSKFLGASLGFPCNPNTHWLQVRPAPPRSWQGSMEPKKGVTQSVVPRWWWSRPSMWILQILPLLPWILMVSV